MVLSGEMGISSSLRASVRPSSARATALTAVCTRRLLVSSLRCLCQVRSRCLPLPAIPSFPRGSGLDEQLGQNPRQSSQQHTSYATSTGTGCSRDAETSRQGSPAAAARISTISRRDLHSPWTPDQLAGTRSVACAPGRRPTAPQPPPGRCLTTGRVHARAGRDDDGEGCSTLCSVPRACSSPRATASSRGADRVSCRALGLGRRLLPSETSLGRPQDLLDDGRQHARDSTAGSRETDQRSRGIDDVGRRPGAFPAFDDGPRLRRDIDGGGGACATVGNA